MIANIINLEAIEAMVTGFLQDDLYIDDFETVEIDREANKMLVWFRHNAHYDGIWDSVYMCLGDEQLVQLVFDNPLFAMVDDIINIRYTLSWHWEGGGGDDDVTPAGSPPACSLRFEFDFVSVA